MVRNGSRDYPGSLELPGSLEVVVGEQMSCTFACPIPGGPKPSLAMKEWYVVLAPRTRQPLQRSRLGRDFSSPPASGHEFSSMYWWVVYSRKAMIGRGLKRERLTAFLIMRVKDWATNQKSERCQSLFVMGWMVHPLQWVDMLTWNLWVWSYFPEVIKWRNLRWYHFRYRVDPKSMTGVL